LFSLNTNLGNVRWRDFVLAESNFTDTQAHMKYNVYDGKLSLEITWNLCQETGIWSRVDALTNNSAEQIQILKCMPKIAFTVGDYEVYSQKSAWCAESQGGWDSLKRGGMTLGCEGGRTCQGSTPFFGLRESGGDKMACFHIIPCGNWRAYVNTSPSGDAAYLPVIELGLSDENLNMAMPAGSVLRLPEILIQQVTGSKINLAAPALHRYLNKLKDNKKAPPVVYNTWYDRWDAIEISNLREQLAAAKEIGCEVFMVDAGWYGANEGDWVLQTGDWREKQDGAFYGKMTDFADEVRAMGMGFGFWIEPERIGSMAPVLKEHSEWFLPVDNGFFYPNLPDADVYDYLLNEIIHLIDTYDPAWIKWDFNHELGLDPYSSEYFCYYTSFNRLINDLRARKPHVFLEGCASGGLRMDISAFTQFDAYWLSDDVNPHDALSIYENSLLHAVPGFPSKWVTLRIAGKCYRTNEKGEVPLSVVTYPSVGSAWRDFVTVDLDFAVLCAMPGAFGFTCDLAGLPWDVKNRLKEYVTFYKRWRDMITHSSGYVSGAPVKMSENKNWTSIQLSSQTQKEILLFVYRLDHYFDERQIVLIGLDPDRTYLVSQAVSAMNSPVSYSGAQLMRDGIKVCVEKRNGAKVFEILLQD